MMSKILKKAAIYSIIKNITASDHSGDIGLLVSEGIENRKYVCTAFKESYGIGIRDYILNRRLNAAKELLRFTIQPIPEVIEESGIRNEDLFYQLFQENESMTPEEYRRRGLSGLRIRKIRMNVAVD